MSEAQVAERKSDSGLINQSGQINQKKRRVGDGTPGPGRPKGQGNRLTENIREAIEIAAKTCHPQGLAGWLVERANGSLGDRQIFAGMVGRVVPLQVNQNVNGGISINLNWLGGRAIGTVSAQPKVIDAQTVELIEDSGARHWIADANTPEPAAQSLQDTQSARASADTESAVIVDPAGSEGPSRGIGAAGAPPPPPKAGAGGVAEAGAPSASLASPK